MERVRKDLWGRKNHAAKLSVSKVKYIRKMWPHKTQEELARKYGVNKSTIHMVVSGFNWRHCL